ncbi:MAG: LytTR family DNA-binding domain-containing protein [Candidatus Kapabacteria bacterium]|nr:LytTR family DNA-binding domain-containing protein [Candidatus Kapabacteria bacterium]
MSETIKAVIIDDEENFSSALEIQIRKQFQNISILGKATTIKEGIKLINNIKPDLVFLDINFPEGNGFEILESAKYTRFEVIFTSSYSEYAVRAFEVSAIHYLLKPIDPVKLKEAINRFTLKIDNNKFDEKLRILKESLQDKPQKILLPTSDGQNIFNISEIVRCEADSSYSTVFFNNGSKLMIAKPLQHLHKILVELDFVRIHSKHLVNLKYVKKYVSGRSPHLILTDGTDLQISQHQKSDFVDKLKRYVKSV